MINGMEISWSNLDGRGSRNLLARSVMWVRVVVSCGASTNCARVALGKRVCNIERVLVSGTSLNSGRSSDRLSIAIVVVGCGSRGRAGAALGSGCVLISSKGLDNIVHEFSLGSLGDLDCWHSLQEHGNREANCELFHFYY